MESGRLWASIARHWLLSLIVLVLVLGAAMAAAFLPHSSYESTATFGLTPTNSTSSTELAAAVVPSYLATIDSDTTEALVRATLTGPAKTVNWNATGENEPGTLVIRVHVTSQDQSIVAPVANAYVKYVGALASKSFAPTTTTTTTTTKTTTTGGTNPVKGSTTTVTTTPESGPAVTLAVMDVARTPTSPVAPNRALILAAGAILGVILASCAALLAGNKPRRNRGTQAPRPSAGPPAVVPQELPTPMESVRTVEPIRG